jgi:hypothetical protein
MIAERRQDIVLHSDRYNIYYLTSYLSAVIGNLSKREMAIYSVELTPGPQSLGCSITLDPPSQPFGFTSPVWVTYNASWNEHRGWRCHIRHLVSEQSTIHRYLGEPLVPAPQVVADFIVGLSRVQTLTTLGPERPAARRRHTPQELTDELSRFTPTCAWVG